MSKKTTELMQELERHKHEVAAKPADERFYVLDVLNSKLKLEEDLDEEEWDQLISINEELKEEFLPLIIRLARVGLLTFVVDDRTYIKKKYRSVDFEVTDAFDNGNIWLVAGESSGHKPALTGDGIPNLGKNPSIKEFTRETYRHVKSPKLSYSDWLKSNQSKLENDFRKYLASFAEKKVSHE